MASFAFFARSFSSFDIITGSTGLPLVVEFDDFDCVLVLRNGVTRKYSIGGDDGEEF